MANTLEAQILSAMLAFATFNKSYNDNLAKNATSMKNGILRILYYVQK